MSQNINSYEADAKKLAQKKKILWSFKKNNFNKGAISTKGFLGYYIVTESLIYALKQNYKQTKDWIIFYSLQKKLIILLAQLNSFQLNLKSIGPYIKNKLQQKLYISFQEKIFCQTLHRINRYNYSQAFEQIIIQFLSYNTFQRPSYVQVLNIINSFDSATIANHFYVKCSQQPVLLDTMNTITKSDQKTERSPELNNYKAKTFNSNSTPQTIKVASLVRTKPTIQQFSLTPEPRPFINRPQSSSRQNSQRAQSSQRVEQVQKPQLPNYSYYDPYIDSALKKSKDLLIYHNQNQNQVRQSRTSSLSVNKYTPVMASLNIQNDDYAQNYHNAQQLIKQVNIEEGKQKQQFSKSFTQQ